jgi:endonuclease/exonuclease/phosphatase family metal-dependent hydrolase
MKLRFAVYNMEWMRDLFKKDGTPKQPGQGSAEDQKDAARSARLAEVVKAIKPDILCIVEGPDTLKDGSKTASKQLEAWRNLHGMNSKYKGVHGIVSGGQQELCALYRKDKVHLAHKPEKNAKKHPFDKPFLVDTNHTLIKEQYKHYRPPLELSVRKASDTSKELARIIVVHTKSKGIFDAVDMARFEQLSERDRMKLYAECFSVRERCDQWLTKDPNLKLIVAGDVNDGFGLDYYEQRFRRSAVEILLGTVWEPEKILSHVLPRPKLGSYGWDPSSSRYQDRLTHDQFNVLIDHVLVSQSVQFENALVWNPYLSKAPVEVKNLKTQLKEASDHFPVSIDITL